MSRSGAPSRSTAREVVALAGLAPSVHNTQPWSWRVDRAGLWLYADRSRQLAVEDPHGRDLIISCGAALHHAQVAAPALGWDAEVQLCPEGPDSSLLAEVRLTAAAPTETAGGDLQALRDRCTDRRKFTAWPVPAPRLERLGGKARLYGALAQPVIDGSTRFRLELAVHRALTVRAADAAATAEQQSWIDRGQYDGVPRAVVPAEPAAGGRRSRFGTGLLEDPRPDVDSSDGLIILGSHADDTESWLRTGQGLSALWLQATQEGLSVVPLSQPIEVDATRREIEDRVLQGSMSAHLLLRIGWQAIGRSQLPRTSRRPLDDILSR